MITSYENYLRYLEADQKALARKGKYSFRRGLHDPIWHFERVLREREYLLNCKPKTQSIFWRLRRRVNKWWYNHLSYKLSFTIPPNVFDEGLRITHYGTIVIHQAARIGKNCEINVGVNIGTSFACEVPIIGDNCFIGPGAKLFGGIKLGDNVQIGANAVVNKSFPEGNCSLVGVPARAVPLKNGVVVNRYHEAKE